MTDKQETENKAKAFLAEINALHNKHLPTHLKAESALEIADIDTYRQVYESCSKEDLVEMIMANHIMFDQLHNKLVSANQNFEQMLLDVAPAIDELKYPNVANKVKSILTIIRLRQNGMSEEEIRRRVEGGQTIQTQEQKILV